MDALTRHKKTEHGLDTQTETIKRLAPIQEPKSLVARHHKPKLGNEDMTPIGFSNKKRKLAREEDHSDKHKRGKLDSGKPLTAAASGESEDFEPYDDAIHTQRDRQPSSSSISTSGLLPQNKYKIAKAKLKYILRENEMLNDEWASIQRRLSRLQTERRVLLDVLVTAEGDQDGDLVSSSDGDDDNDDVDIDNEGNHNNSNYGMDDDIDEGDNDLGQERVIIDIPATYNEYI